MSIDHVKIVRRGSSELEQTIWTFYRLGSDLVLDSYAQETRASLRHKFKRGLYWLRLYERDCALKRDQVPLPEDVKTEALEAHLAQLRAVMTVRF